MRFLFVLALFAIHLTLLQNVYAKIEQIAHNAFFISEIMQKEGSDPNGGTEEFHINDMDEAIIYVARLSFIANDGFEYIAYLLKTKSGRYFIHQRDRSTPPGPPLIAHAMAIDPAGHITCSGIDLTDHPKITIEIDEIKKNNGKVAIVVKDDAPPVEKQQIFSEYRITDERTFE